MIVLIGFYVALTCTIYARGIPAAKSAWKRDLPATGTVADLTVDLIAWAFVAALWPIWLPFWLIAKLALR
jgi:hypothetical protein